MKKERVMAITLVLVLTVSSVAFGASALETINVARNDATIYVNGNVLNADNFNYNGSLYVPLRAVSENMGMNVSWNDIDKSATIKNDEIIKSSNEMYFSHLIANYAHELYSIHIGVLNYLTFDYSASSLDTLEAWSKEVVSKLEQAKSSASTNYINQDYVDMYNSITEYANDTQSLVKTIKQDGITYKSSSSSEWFQKSKSIVSSINELMDLADKKFIESYMAIQSK